MQNTITAFAPYFFRVIVCINVGTFFACPKLVMLFSTSVHNVGLKCIVFLTFSRVAKLALDKIHFKKSLYFPYYFTIFPILGLYFWKITPILSPIFLLKALLKPCDAHLITVQTMIILATKYAKGHHIPYLYSCL